MMYDNFRERWADVLKARIERKPEREPERIEPKSTRTLSLKEQGDQQVSVLRKYATNVESLPAEYNLDGILRFSLTLCPLELMPTNFIFPVNVSKLVEFLDNVIRPSDEKVYQAILGIYNITGNIPDSKRKKLVRKYMNAIYSYITLDNAYLYFSPAFKASVPLLSKALEVPEDMEMDELTRFKWVRLYYIIFNLTTMFSNELDSEHRMQTAERSKFVETLYLMPDSLLTLAFSKISEKSINYKAMKAFMDSYPQEIQDEVYRFAELSGIAPGVQKFAYARNIKKLLFPIPTGTKNYGFFFTTKGFNEMDSDTLKFAISAYKAGGVKSLKTKSYYLPDIFDLPNGDGKLTKEQRKNNGYNYKDFDLYVIGYGDDHDLVVSSDNELCCYVQVYNYLLEHPDFRFGSENKTLAEYGMDHLMDEPITVETESAEANAAVDNPAPIEEVLGYDLINNDEVFNIVLNPKSWTL